MEIRAKLSARPLQEAACLAGGWVPSMAPQLGELLLLLLVLFLVVATLLRLTQRRLRGHSHGHSRSQARSQSHTRASHVGLRLLLAAALLGGLAVSSAIHSIRPARDGMPVGESGKVCAPHTSRQTSCMGAPAPLCAVPFMSLPTRLKRGTSGAVSKPRGERREREQRLLPHRGELGAQLLRRFESQWRRALLEQPRGVRWRELHPPDAR